MCHDVQTADRFYVTNLSAKQALEHRRLFEAALEGEDNSTAGLKQVRRGVTDEPRKRVKKPQKKPQKKPRGTHQPLLRVPRPAR